MTERFDRDVYFDAVRGPLFSGSLTQQQVDGQNAILADWEGSYGNDDLRWLAYALATAVHETASTMWPIEEYGKGSGMEYGKKDPETGQTYYGRGYVQLTWRDNYQKATDKLELSGDQDLVWHASQALDPFIAGHIMFRGMIEGWFRSDSKGRQTLGRYFNDSVDDAYGAREIINGDKTKIPDWGQGKSIGNLIAGYHDDFLAALKASLVEVVPIPEPAGEVSIDISTNLPPGIRITVTVNGVSPNIDGELVTTG